VYARRKGPVKRKGVISMGCEMNCPLPFLANAGKSRTKSFQYNILRWPERLPFSFAGKTQNRLGKGRQTIRKMPESDPCPCMGAGLPGPE
jgi:hypothetical protein